MKHTIVHAKSATEAETALDSYIAGGHTLLQVSPVSVGTINMPQVHIVLTFRKEADSILEGAQS